MKSLIGWALFLLLNLCLAALIVYLIEVHEDAVWSIYWGLLALFSCYALFLAGWLTFKSLRIRFRRKPIFTPD